jgi:hypothetical protein
MPPLKQFVRVKLPPTNKGYDFFTHQILVRYDLVVVDTANGYVLGRVDCMLPEAPRADKWVVCKVPLQEHARRLKEIEPPRGNRGGKKTDDYECATCQDRKKVDADLGVSSLIRMDCPDCT